MTLPIYSVHAALHPLRSTTPVGWYVDTTMFSQLYFHGSQSVKMFTISIAEVMVITAVVMVVVIQLCEVLV